MTPAEPAPAPPILLIAFNHQLFGLDPVTAAIRWELDGVGGAGTRLFVTLDYALVLGGGVFACVDTMSGRLHWKVASVGDTLLYPGGERIFVGGNGETECFAIRTGALLWKQTFKGRGYGGVSLGVPGAVAQVDLAP